MIFEVQWRRKIFPKATSCGFVKATDENDARRIMIGNLSSEYEIADVNETDPVRVTPESITINFRHKDLHRLKVK